MGKNKSQLKPTLDLELEPIFPERPKKKNRIVITIIIIIIVIIIMIVH